MVDFMKKLSLVIDSVLVMPWRIRNAAGLWSPTSAK